MRKALIVGIDYYDNVSDLFGCVSDACAVKNVLERNSDGTINFSANLMIATSDACKVERKALKKQTEELFKGDAEVALFYYAGHGNIENTGGYLFTSECRDGDDGFPLAELMIIANKSKAKNKIIILDSCHSGVVAEMQDFKDFALISEGMTILTACSKDQYACEENGHGVFTTLLVDALYGGASNLVGEVTPGSVYAHIDQSLGPWEQRPLFKTNIKNFISLRKNSPPIHLSNLHEIPQLFKNYNDEFCLNPSFEPEHPSHISENCEKFKILQSLNRVNLVVPVGADHMYFAAIENRSCKLTPLGVHYWKLVKNNRI